MNIQADDVCANQADRHEYTEGNKMELQLK